MEILNKKEKKELAGLLVKVVKNSVERLLNDIFAITYLFFLPFSLLLFAFKLMVITDEILVLIAMIFIVTFVFSSLYENLKTGKVFIKSRIGGKTKDKEIRYAVFRENRRRVRRHERLLKKGINEPYHYITEKDVRIARKKSISLYKI